MVKTNLGITRILGGTLLVSGTTIGGGILAFPVSTGLSGFWPSIGLFVLFWAFMLFSALVLLEACLRMKKETDLISMATFSLGRVGTFIGWTSYLFLLYSLLTAYTAAGAGMINDFLYNFFEFELPSWIEPLPVVILFGGFIAAGTAAVDRINRLMMLGLVLTFVTIAGFLAPFVEVERLSHIDFSFLSATTSVIATAFGFHIIIPTLTTYMKRDTRALQLTMVIGTLIPLVAYILWELVTLGSIPLEGENGLIQAQQWGLPITRPLRALFSSPVLPILIHAFEFFAIITSFLGVGLSLAHFLKDGLGAKKNSAMIWVLTFGPPVFITATNPGVFLKAIEYAGTFGVLVLLALLPALMAWSGRRKDTQATYLAPGGKASLVLLMLFSLFFIGLESCRKLGLLG